MRRSVRQHLGLDQTKMVAQQRGGGNTVSPWETLCGSEVYFACLPFFYTIRAFDEFCVSLRFHLQLNQVEPHL